MELLGQRHVFSKILKDTPKLLFFGVVPIYISPPMYGASQVAQTVKNLPAIQETQVQFVGWEDPLEKKMAAHSSTLVWKIPWMEDHDRLQSMGVAKSQTQLRNFIFTFT